jgi:hypothetical protein
MPSFTLGLSLGYIVARQWSYGRIANLHRLRLAQIIVISQMECFQRRMKGSFICDLNVLSQDIIVRIDPGVMAIILIYLLLLLINKLLSISCRHSLCNRAFALARLNWYL